MLVKISKSRQKKETKYKREKERGNGCLLEVSKVFFYQTNYSY